MSNYVLLSSLSMDLKRAALGYYRGSLKVGQQFLEEGMQRKNELDQPVLPDYVVRLLDKLELIGKIEDEQKKAEELLLCSTLFQNASLKLK